MQKVKIFKSVETEVTNLEQEINEWLEQSGARITNMKGNIAPQTLNAQSTGTLATGRYSPSDILVIFLYEIP